MRLLTSLGMSFCLLPACREASTPPTEPFQFPIAICIQGRSNDYWDSVLRGVDQRLSLPGVQLAKVFFTESERPALAPRLQGGDWRAVAFCVPNDSWVKETVERLIQAGTPVVLIGVDLPETARLGYVGTYYYDAGRRAGAWYARRMNSGEVAVVAGHPVPRAVSEFWEGFRHGTLFNRRVRARLVPLSDSRNSPSVIQKLASEGRVKGIFLMGAEVAQRGIGAARLNNIGVLSWRESAKDWYFSKQIDLLILERPEEIGVRAANLLRNLSQGRGADLQIVYVPYDWRAR